jgi:hypothetical protein
VEQAQQRREGDHLITDPRSDLAEMIELALNLNRQAMLAEDEVRYDAHMRGGFAVLVEISSKPVLRYLDAAQIERVCARWLADPKKTVPNKNEAWNKQRAAGAKGRTKAARVKAKT